MSCYQLGIGWTAWMVMMKSHTNNSVEKQETFCSKCDIAINENDSIYQCDVCQQYIHKSCAELTPSEVKCMPLQKRTLLFVCKNCTIFVKKLPLMVQMLEEIKMEIKDIKVGNQLNLNNSENLSQKKSYSDVIKQKKTNPVVIIRPKKQQGSQITKKDIRRNIDPAGLNISKFRQAHGGAVVIGCESKNQIIQLQDKIKQNLGEQYSVELPNQKKPKLKIVNINSEDVSTEDDDLSIVDEIIKSNEIEIKEDFHMKILKKFTNKYKNVSLILETDPRTHNFLLNKIKVKVGWSRCSIFNHVSILQCYNCFNFGHYAKDCKSNKVCSKCSEHHEYSYKDCKSQALKCINCLKLSQSQNIQLNIDHSPLDKNCHCMLKVLNLQDQKIEYFSGQ